VAGIFATKKLDGLIWTIAVVASIFLGKAILTWLNRWLGQRTSAAVKSQLRTDIMRARLARPVESEGSTGGLVTLVTQGLDALDPYYARYLPQLLLAATVPVIICVAILTSDWVSTVIVVVTIPLIPLFMTLIGWTTQARTAKRWAIQTRLARHFSDLVMGLPTLQVFGRAKAQAQGLRITETAHRRETVATLRISFLSALVLELLATLSVAVIAVTIGFRLLYGQVDLQTALFILILAPEAYIPVRQVGTHFHDSTNGVAAARSAFALIDAGSDASAPSGESADSLAQEAGVASGADRDSADLVAESGAADAGNPIRRTVRGPQPQAADLHLGEELFTSGEQDSRHPLSGHVGEGGLAAGAASVVGCAADSRHPLSGHVSDRGEHGGEIPLLSVRGLSHTYDGADTPALSGFDLDVYPGEIVALAGASGGGKTTVLNSVMGFLSPSAGRILADGKRVRDVDEWRTHVAYVGQFPGLIAGTVADNVRLGFPKATDSAVRAALDEAGAADIALDHPVAMDAEGVSAGERRRIATARGLLRVTLGRARLMVLDEPTAGLDAESESVLLATLRKLGVAALVVSHRPQVLDSADRVVYLERVPQVVGVEAGQVAGVGAGSATQEQEGQPSALGGGDAADADGSGETAQGDGPSDAEASSSASDFDEFAPSGRRRSLVRRLFDSVPGSRVRLVIAIVMAFCATTASVALMGVSTWLLSFAATHPPEMYLNVAAVGVRFFGISRGVFRYLERLTGHDVALRLQSALRLETYKSLAKTTLLGSRRGDLLSRVIADVEAIQNLIVRVWIPFWSSSLVIVATAVTLAFFSPGSALVLLISAILAGLIVPFAAMRGSHRADRESVPTRGELADRVHELAHTASDVVAYGQQPAFIGRFEAVDHRLRDGEARVAWVRGVADGFQMLAAGLAVLGALWIGGQQVAAGTLDPVMLAVLVLVPLSLHESLSTLSEAAQNSTRAHEALRRVEEVTDAEPVGVGDLPDRLTDATPSLHVHNLTAGWPDNPPVVTGLNLDVDAGQHVALTGPSGVGKTTVAATILGLIEARGGDLELSGRPGYLAQDAHIFNTTVAENVRIGRKDATDEEIAQALGRAGLLDIDLHRIVGEEGSALSGGEIRRISLARLLVGQYQVLILDEPTEHLDTLTATALLDDVWTTAADLPILAITHDPELIARCDREVALG